MNSCNHSPDLETFVEEIELDAVAYYAIMYFIRRHKAGSKEATELP